MESAKNLNIMVLLWSYDIKLDMFFFGVWGAGARGH